MRVCLVHILIGQHTSKHLVRTGHIVAATVPLSLALCCPSHVWLAKLPVTQQPVSE